MVFRKLDIWNNERYMYSYLILPTVLFTHKKLICHCVNGAYIVAWFETFLLFEFLLLAQ